MLNGKVALFLKASSLHLNNFTKDKKNVQFSLLFVSPLKTGHVWIQGPATALVSAGYKNLSKVLNHIFI